MAASSALPYFPLGIETGPGLAASRDGASLRLDLVDVPVPAVKKNDVYRAETGTNLTRIKAGLRLLVKPSANSDGPAMLSVDGIGPLPWLDADGSPLYDGLIRKDAFTVVRGDPERGWLLEAGGVGSTGLSFDFSGTLAERATYDAQPKSTVYLAVGGTSAEPAWTLFFKRSNAPGDWSAGLPVKATPAQSTAASEAARDAAIAQAGVATAAAGTATTQAGIATARASTATTQAGISTAQAGLADTARTAAQAAADIATAAQPGMVFDYPTRTAAAAASIPAAKLFIRTAGLSATNDGLGAVYVRSSTSTVSSGGFQSADGARWDLAPAKVTALGSKTFPVPREVRAGVTKSIYDYGLVSGTTDITAALANIRAATDSPVVFIPEGNYTVSTPKDTQYFSSNTSLRGAGLGRTVIQILGDDTGKISRSLLAWSNNTGVGAQELTIDVNGVQAGGTSLIPVIQTGNVYDFLLDRFEIKGMLGDRLTGTYHLKTRKGRIYRSRFAFSEANNLINGGVYLDNSYYGSVNFGRISDRTMTITKFGGRGAPEGLYEGLPLEGDGVPLNAQIVRQISGTTGREGVYEISHPANVPDGTRICGVPNDDWIVDDNEFVGTCLYVESTRFISSNNNFNGCMSGCSLIHGFFSAGVKTINDGFRDGNYTKDGRYVTDPFGLFGDAIECHANFAEIINPRVENMANGLIGVSGNDVKLVGGRIKKFGQGSTQNATLTGSTSGNKLTVASVSAGYVLKGQIITGPGIAANTKIDSDDGNGVFTLTQAVTSASNGQTFQTAAALDGGAIRLQRIVDAASGLSRTSARFQATGTDIQGTGTLGEKYAVVDQDPLTGIGTKISDLTTSGLTVSPYKIAGGAVIVDPGAALTAAQIALVAPNLRTVLGVRGVGLTAGGVVSGNGPYSALAFGDGSQFAAVAPPAWAEYVPTFTPNVAFTTGSITLARASYTIVGKIFSIQMRFTLPAGGGAPGFINISLPSGVTLRDIGAGTWKNVSNGAGGFVHDNNATTLQMDNKGTLTDGAVVSLSYTGELL